MNTTLNISSQVHFDLTTYMLTGKHHFGSPDLMQKLLEKEGVKVEKDTVENFDKIFWNPSTELSI